MRAVALLALAALTACTSVTDSVTRRAAKSVVNPVLAQYMPSGQAAAATDCVITNASSAELGALAQDVGTRAGTSTVQTVMGIVTRPATTQCLLAQGLPTLPGAGF
ncbi:hypothetical protein [Falsirhodobacter halotolerans]|uniref:hypothetical protein n=1 Tax=Falsirhodobacter halotolerans TaxID=1146892 RepID=UPI001FD5E790|nr:hypothetical protein [Falsirhodobacter halotolerans]MCJ8140447.1 hypothetical protein [Falsirhodobacter halotolerans]